MNDSGKLKIVAEMDDKSVMDGINNMKKGVNALGGEVIKMTEKQQKAYERLANTIKSNQNALKTATDPTQVALYKKRIDEATVSMQKLIATASKPVAPAQFKVSPYDSRGNTIGQMQDALRSFKDQLVVEKDINNVRQLNQNIQGLETNITKMSNAGKKGFDELGNAIPTQKVSSFGRLFSNIISSFGIFAGISTVTTLLRSFYDTTKQLEVLNKSMELGAKDTQTYASNVEFLDKITQDYGLELISTSEAYNKFYIASKNKLALNDIQLIFDKISKSASLMGISVSDQAGIFRALEQMMSKGTVQAEELRGQLGDRLPGAFETMARSMGVSTKELGKMMENGEVMASEVLPKFAIELEKSFGAEKVTMINNLTAAENRLKNEWTQMVESVNGSNGVLTNTFSLVVNWISRMVKGFSTLVILGSGVVDYFRVLGASIIGLADTSLGFFNVIKLAATGNFSEAKDEITKNFKAMEKAANKGSESLKKVLQNTSNALTGGNKINGFGTWGFWDKPKGDDPVDKGLTAAQKRAMESLAKKRIDFISEIQKAEDNLNKSTLSGLDLELAKVNEVYNERIKKAKELKANQSVFDRIEALKVKETENVTYKNETENIKNALEVSKKDYEDFEAYKRKIGVEEAKKMYSEIIDTSKTYYDFLNDEINKLSGKDNLTDLEKDRLNVLFKLYQDYNISKADSDRKNLEELYAMTMSYEQKILVLREEYNKKRADLSKDYTGEDLQARLDILNKEFEAKARELINNFADEKGFGTQITQGFIGATKQIISAQIDGLRNYLKNTKNLTKNQVDEIEKLIKNLDEKLYTASDNGQGGALKILNTQIQGLNASAKKLEERKSFLESLNLPETSVELAEIETLLIGIRVQLDTLAGAKAKAISEEFGKISSIFSQIADSVESMGSGSNNIFRSFSKIAGVAGQVSSAFASIKEFQEAQKSDEGASFTQGLSAFGGILSAVFSITSMIMNAMDDYNRAIDESAKRKTESYIKSLEFERELLAIETERIRRNAISISDRQKEAESINREILLKVKQIDELQKKINDFASFYLRSELEGTNLFKNLFGDVSDLQALYDQLKKMRDLGQEMTQQQKEQLALLDAFWLGGRSWDELQQVLNNLTGKYIRDDMRANVEQAIKLAKELEEAGYTLEDVKNMIREMSTGTSMDELSNALADAFRNGEDAVISFGNTIEEVLKNAIITSFKNEFIVKEMDKFFKLFGDMGAGGYTEEELDEIRRLAKEMAERLQLQWDAMGGVLDQFDFGSEQLGGSLKDGIQRITESQADRLTGILTGMQVDVIASRQILSDSKNLLSSSLDNLVKIEVNTRRTYEGVERIETILQNNQLTALGL